MKKYKPKRFETKKFELNKREDSSSRGYDSDWSKFTFRFKHYNSKCYACGSGERINVDHIKNKKEFPEFAETDNNFMPLCQSCHSTVTAKFEQSLPMNLVGKLDWIKTRREETKTKVIIKVIPYRKKKGPAEKRN
jgi:5-methylcytosine-specific restriction endonuclease McrA